MERSLNDDKAQEGVIYYDDRLALIDRNGRRLSKSTFSYHCCA